MTKKNLIITVLLFFLTQLTILNSSDTKRVKYDFQVDIGSYFINDQRIQWSGVEATFGAEAELIAKFGKKIKNGEVFALSEFRFNQKFDDNILIDKFRKNYIQNFKTDQFLITQLYLGVQFKNFSIAIGKKDSVFGDEHNIRLINSQLFSPFIRTESILRQETGVFLNFSKGIIRLDISVVNGGPEKDTNSSKAAVLRAGLEFKNFSLGMSAKIQDGIGSEWQKQYKNHLGFDFLIKSGRFSISAEGIYDEYGFRKEFDEKKIFWKRSLYYRDRFFKLETPITGIGGYVDLCYKGKKFTFNLNYGEFHPKKIGYIYHDHPIKRSIVKFIYNFTKEFSLFAGGLFENDRPRESVFSGAKGYAYIVGLKYKIY